MGKVKYSGIMCGRIMESFYTYAHVSNLVYEGMDLGMDVIQLFPNMLARAQQVREGKDTKLQFCAVVAYPHGTYLPEQKAFEVTDCIESGADQLEVMLNVVNARSGEWDAVREEFRQCRQAAGSRVLKFNIEAEYLKDEALKKVCELAVEEKIDRLCTSVGVYPGKKNGEDTVMGAEPETVKKIKEWTKEKISVEAEGQIRSAAQCDALLSAGADYLCSEYAAKIMREGGSF